ncbi:MAG: hypothetical protein FWC91_10365 [Defluviitaleaceae bacterium]|nr:hypothetical protein [Defluviitaleaceae bacterium]
MNTKNNTRFKVSQNILVIASILIIGVLFATYFFMSKDLRDNSLPMSRELFTLENYYNMTVLVVFDQEEPPIVQFISPDGSHVDMDNIRYRSGSNFTQYFLPNAMPGLWKMAYNPLSNTEITTPYSVYMEHIFIQNFEASMIIDEDGAIPISFLVSADEPGEVRLELYAVFTAWDNSVENEILLFSEYGPLNEVIERAVYIGELQDMGGFMLRLSAYKQHGQAAIRDSAWFDLRLS